MDIACAADCGPSLTIIVLLLLGAVVALLIVRRARWSIIVTAPLLYTAVGIFAGQGYSHTPPWWLTVSVLGLPLLGVVRWPRVRNGQSQRPA
jgi:hypothetical protein